MLLGSLALPVQQPKPSSSLSEGGDSDDGEILGRILSKNADDDDGNGIAGTPTAPIDVLATVVVVVDVDVDDDDDDGVVDDEEVMEELSSMSSSSSSSSSEMIEPKWLRSSSQKRKSW